MSLEPVSTPAVLPAQGEPGGPLAPYLPRRQRGVELRRRVARLAREHPVATATLSSAATQVTLAALRRWTGSRVAAPPATVVVVRLVEHHLHPLPVLAPNPAGGQTT